MRLLYLLFILLLVNGCKSVSVFIEPDSINVKDFGAIPNDGKDDSDAIQAAIDYAIKSKKSSIVYFPPGIYDLNQGIVVINDDGTEKVNFITIKITGHQAAYSSNQRIGSTSVLRLRNADFGIAIQGARNCTIENLVIRGEAGYYENTQKIETWSDYEWKNRFNVSTNRFSPSCGIVIDPFHKNVPIQDRYSGFEHLYKYKTNSGSSMILIKGCSFLDHYIAIANNPSNGFQNGDNIRAEQCHVNSVHTFWSAGQSQSRGNSIENIYALRMHTFISTSEIGEQNGTPPTVSNVNVAGFCKYVFDISTGYSSLNVYRSYFESIWSLGMTNGIHTSFDQCQFSFRKPDDKIGAPLFHLFSDRVVSFRDCDIQYFNSCRMPMPFLFKSKELLISGGSIEGGVVVADGITNKGGDQLNRVQMEGVYIKCLDRKVAGKKTTMRPQENIREDIILGGEIIYTTEGDLYINSGTTYNVEYLGIVNITKDNKDYSFNKSSNVNIETGDNLFIENKVTLSGSKFLEGRYIQPAIGYIKEIKENNVIITGVPEDLSLTKVRLYKVSYPRLNNILEQIEKGSQNVIKFKKEN